MSRAVEEWIGFDANAPIPKRVKLRVLLAYGGKCYRTGHKFRPGDKIEFDHIKALCNGGENRESNLAPILGGKVHQEKTREDVSERVKTDRMRAKNLGLWPPPARKIASRGFPKRAPHD
jgi:5-methylcytosine-specific restriction protein A